MGLTISPMHVRRSIFVNADPARVWNEFETTERITHWFGIGHEIHSMELLVGGTVDLSIDNDYGIETGEDGRVHLVGEVLVFDAMQELSFRTAWRGYEANTVAYWTIRLSALYDGTLVELFQHGIELAGDEAADRLRDDEDGWDIRHLKRLRETVEA